MTLSRRSLLGAALALPVLAACGDNAAEANGRKKVRLTYGAISVPKTRGVFEQTLKDQGIDVEWVGPFPNHAPTLQAVSTSAESTSRPSHASTSPSSSPLFSFIAASSGKKSSVLSCRCLRFLLPDTISNNIMP